MADNPTVSSAFSATVAADDVGGVYYPRTKVTLGADGAATADLGAMTPADNLANPSNILQVGGYLHVWDSGNSQWIRLKVETPTNDGESGELAIPVENYSMVFNGTNWDRLRGSINNGALVQPCPKTVRIQSTPTLDTSAYTSGDNLAYGAGGNGNSIALANAARVSGGSGLIQSITVLDKTQAQRAAIDILFFDRSVAAGGNINAAVAVSDADMAYCLGVVSIGPYNTAWPGTPLNSISTTMNIGLPYVLNGTDLHFLAVVRGTPTYGASDLVFSFTLLQD